MTLTPPGGRPSPGGGVRMEGLHEELSPVLVPGLGGPWPGLCPPGGGLHRLHRLSLPLTDSRIPLHAESEELSRETSTPTPRGWLSFDEGGSGQPLGPGSLGPETPRVRNGKDRPVHLQRRVSDPGQGGGGTKAGAPAERLGLSRHCPRFRCAEVRPEVLGRELGTPPPRTPPGPRSPAPPRYSRQGPVRLERSL